MITLCAWIIVLIVTNMVLQAILPDWIYIALATMGMFGVILWAFAIAIGSII